MKAIVSWSGGKDCAWALACSLAGAPGLEIVALLTTIREDNDSVDIHEVPRESIALQAEAMGVPLWTALLPAACPNRIYLARLQPLFRRAVEAGAEAILFGDLFLQEIRAFREEMLVDSGLVPVFPLWGRDTRVLAEQMIDGGLRSTVTAAHDRRFLGRAFDRSLLQDLPPGTDPCGENGEFHTFTWDAPMFKHPIPCPPAKCRASSH